MKEGNNCSKCKVRKNKKSNLKYLIIIAISFQRSLKDPVVNIGCWHIQCEKCWLLALVSWTPNTLANCMNVQVPPFISPRLSQCAVHIHNSSIKSTLFFRVLPRKAAAFAVLPLPPLTSEGSSCDLPYLEDWTKREEEALKKPCSSSRKKKEREYEPKSVHATN